MPSDRTASSSAAVSMPSARISTPSAGRSPRCLDDAAAAIIAVEAAQDIHVDLDEVRLEIRQQAQAREARAEIVERRHETLLPVGRDDALEMVDIPEPLVLGELEHDPAVREADPPRRLEGRADAGIRLVDRVRHEVDGQAHVLVPREERAGSSMAFTRAA